MILYILKQHNVFAETNIPSSIINITKHFMFDQKDNNLAISHALTSSLATSL